MKDVTSTSFGLVIAFLLPGLMALYALSLFYQPLHSLFATFLQAESNVGLFLLVTLAALATGLQVAIVRALLFQHWLCRKWRLTPDDFATLAAAGRLEAFRATVDEHYRYHQFWGGMVVVMPILFIQWLFAAPLFSGKWFGLLVTFLALEGVTVWAAWQSYVAYVDRSRAILKEVKSA
jgi:hypothetical protein